MIDAIDVWIILGIVGWLLSLYLWLRLTVAIEGKEGLERLIETMNFLRYARSQKMIDFDTDPQQQERERKKEAIKRLVLYLNSFSTDAIDAIHKIMLEQYMERQVD